MYNFNNLDSENWIQLAKSIYDDLKIELQSGGLIKKVKFKVEPNLNKQVDALFSRIRVNNNFFDLDDQINKFTNGLLKINNDTSSIIYYDHINLLNKMIKFETYPHIRAALTFIRENKTNSQETLRLQSIISRVVNESLNQSNKSNAGLAIQTVVRAILTASGLKNGIHYKQKYKSTKSAEANFVFPALTDFSDEYVNAVLACQMSSNDRLKLASEELKIGKSKFIFTGNGMDASTKKLKHISDPIIRDLQNKNIKLICYAKEIKYELKRLKDRNSVDSEFRINFFQNNTYSISKFANIINKHFS